MGASVEELIEATYRRLGKSDESVGLGLAIVLAIQGKGIRHEPDVRRLKREVLGEIERRKEGAKKHKYELYPPDIQKAAQGYRKWMLDQALIAKKEYNSEFRENFRKLTRYVFMYIESMYGHLPKAERPDVFEVEACLRSMRAVRAAATRKAKKEKAAKPLSPSQRGKVAAKALREQQQDLF